MTQTPESLINDIQKASALAEYTYDISDVESETRQGTQEIISENFTILDSGLPARDQAVSHPDFAQCAGTGGHADRRDLTGGRRHACGL